MPIFDVEHQGRAFEVEAKDMAAAMEALNSLPPAEDVSTTMDVAKSGGVGLAKGAIGMAGLGGDVRELNASIVNKLSTLAGYELPQDKVSLVLKRLPLMGGPTSQGLQSGIETTTGPFYKPKTTAGEYAQTAGEFAPAAALGPGGFARRAVGQVLLPAAASETAGQAFKGETAEPYARVAGALASPLATSAAERVITPFRATPAHARVVQALQAEGVPLSAGDTTGSKVLRKLEQTLGEVGGRSTAEAERSAEGFTAAALRRVEANSNRAYPEVVDDAFTRNGNQFDQLAARNSLPAHPQMGREIRAAVDEYNGLVSIPNRAPIIANFEAEIGTALARNNGVLPGEIYQSLRSRMEAQARGAPPEVASTLRGMRGALDDAMERHLAATGSADLGAWQNARNVYRNLLVIERAVTGAGADTAKGLISPSQLRTAVAGMGRRNFARGGGDFNELAHAGEGVLRPLPNSGTPAGVYVNSLPASLGTAAAGLFTGNLPMAAGGALAAAGPPLLGRALMSGPMQRYLGNQRLANMPPRQNSRDAAIAALLASPRLPTQ
jgi:hypothetical protein